MVKKADLVEEAQMLGLTVGSNNTVPELKEAIEKAKGSEDKAKQPEEKVSVEGESVVEQESGDDDETALAKAGKRSAKAAKEAEEKEAKEARKSAKTTDDATEKPKQPTQKVRSRLERRGKKYRELAKQIDQAKEYSVEEAVALAQKTSTTTFDSSLELHVNLGVDPRQSDQNIRGTVVLPHGTGKSLRVAVFGGEEEVKAAQAAGADVAAGEEFLETLKKEEINFDILIATPETMPKLGQYAKLLGPKGLMPNPKSGTVTKDVATAVREAKAGKVEFRVDKQSILHASFGKVSFPTEQLVANLQALLKAIQDARPPSVKGIYIEKIIVTTTMGPSIKVDLKGI